MNSITLTKKQLNSLTRLDVGSAKNSEGEMYILDHGNWNYSDGSLLLKKLFIVDGEAMANKLFTVSLLGDKKEDIDMNELVIPNNLAVVKNEVIGFTVPLIPEAKNLKVILDNPKIDNSIKIDYLYKVGKMLKKVNSLNRRKIINLTIGDLHEDNILVTKDHDIRVVDLDSAYLDTSYPTPSFYLRNSEIGNFRKYKFNSSGIVYPTKNTDLLCYNSMILNTISKNRIDKLSVSDYFSYINYLESLGFGQDIVKAFRRVYTNGENINPADYLDQVPEEKMGEALYKVYELKKQKGKVK